MTKLEPLKYELRVVVSIDFMEGEYSPLHPLSRIDYTKLKKHLEGFEFDGTFGEIKITRVLDVQATDPNAHKLCPYG